MTTHATPIRNRMMQIADAKAHTHSLTHIYREVSSWAMQYVTSDDAGARDDATLLLNAVRMALKGEASAQQHGQIARAYSAMRQCGLAD